MKGINREIKVFSVISDFTNKVSVKDSVGEPPIKNTRDSLELRIDKLEKLVSELTHKMQ